MCVAKITRRLLFVLFVQVPRMVRMDIDVHTSGLRLGRAFVALILGTLLVAGCGSDTLGEHAECAEGATISRPVSDFVLHPSPGD